MHDDDDRIDRGSGAGGAGATGGAAGGGHPLVGALAAAVAVGAYAWWAVGLPPFSTAATVTVLAAGCLAALLGARRRPRPRPPLSPGAARLAVAWAALVAVAAALQLAAYLQSPREDHPTISALANALLDSHPARAVAFVAWLAAMVELARR